jgi:hypothetical protein
MKKFKEEHSGSHPLNSTIDTWLHRLSIPFARWLELEMFWISDLFQILEYVHVNNDIPWGWNPSLNLKFICFIYTLYTWSKGNFLQYF